MVERPHMKEKSATTVVTPVPAPAPDPLEVVEPMDVPPQARYRYELPPGGLPGQLLARTGGLDYEVEWVDAPVTEPPADEGSTFRKTIVIPQPDGSVKRRVLLILPDRTRKWEDETEAEAKKRLGEAGEAAEKDLVPKEPAPTKPAKGTPVAAPLVYA